MERRTAALAASLGFFIAALCSPVLARADGLGPGGYQALGMALLVGAIVLVLVVVGLVLLLATGIYFLVTGRKGRA